MREPSQLRLEGKPPENQVETFAAPAALRRFPSARQVFIQVQNVGTTLTRRQCNLAFITTNLLLWIGFALLTGGVVWGLLVPFKAKQAPDAQPAVDDSKDVALYRDQLAEVERDVERGVMGEAEAEAARIEVSRRLLAAVDAVEKAKVARPKTSPRRIALGMMVFVPALSLGLYLLLGSPDVPDEPFAPRIAGHASA